MPSRLVFLLTGSVGIVGANSLVLSPIAAEVSRGLSAGSAANVMVAAAVYGLGVAGSALLLAPRADRIGADRALIGALMILFVSFVASAAAPTLVVLTIAQGVAGVGAGMALPAIYSLAAQIAPKGAEARTIGTVLTGWTLSMVGGVTLSAYVADFAGWRAVYLLLAGGVLLAFLLLRGRDFGRVPARGTPSSPLTALRVSGILPALFSVAMLGTGFYGIYNYIGAHLESALLRPVSDAGLLTLSYGLGFGAAMAIDPYLDRIGPRRGLAVTFGLLGLLYVVMSQSTASYGGLVALVFVWGLLQHMGLNLTVSRLTRLDARQRGAIMGLNSTVMYLSVFAATVFFRPLFEGYGLRATMLASALLAVLGLSEALFARYLALRGARYAR